MDVVISFKKSLEENAGDYFNKAKKAKQKLEGVKEALAVWQNKLDDLRSKEEVYKAELEAKEVVKAKKGPTRWYHKFRWFITSDGFLVVGGRDATTNELVIKKHTEPHDRVMHTDMAGSPFFVLKTEGKEASEATLREVADATCTFSRAWKLGLSAQDVFVVKPEQVTKDAKAGEYLTKGAFVIHGKVEYLENHINLAIGVTKDEEIMAGPEEAIAKHCKKYITLTQGDEKASAIAKHIEKVIGGDTDTIIRSLPAGNFKMGEIKV